MNIARKQDAVGRGSQESQSVNGESVRIREQKILSEAKGVCQVVRYEHRMRDGTWREDRREVYDNGHSAAVLPFDPARRKVLLTRQLRIPVFLDCGAERVIEACAGKLQGMPADERIVREVEEELGYRITTLERLFELFMSPAGFMEKVTMFLARYSAADKVGPGGGLADEGEDIDVVEMALDDAIKMIDVGGIVDAKTVVLLQALLLRLMVVT